MARWREEQEGREEGGKTEVSSGPALSILWTASASV
jgi:hypothetical protein